MEDNSHAFEFIVNLGPDDWDRRFNGWNCPALQIKGSDLGIVQCSVEPNRSRFETLHLKLERQKRGGSWYLVPPVSRPEDLEHYSRRYLVVQILLIEIAGEIKKQEDELKRQEIELKQRELSIREKDSELAAQKLEVEKSRQKVDRLDQRTKIIAGICVVVGASLGAVSAYFKFRSDTVPHTPDTSSRAGHISSDAGRDGYSTVDVDSGVGLGVVPAHPIVIEEDVPTELQRRRTVDNIVSDSDHTDDLIGTWHGTRFSITFSRLENQPLLNLSCSFVDYRSGRSSEVQHRECRVRRGHQEFVMMTDGFPECENSFQFTGGDNLRLVAIPPHACNDMSGTYHRARQ